jgi:uncharacterized membrane protein
MGNFTDRAGRQPPREGDEEAGGQDMGRILALSDGVFAIAITLLILDIVIPATTTDAGLPKALLDLWPQYLAYALSFVVIARFWAIHHQTFRFIARSDATLIWLNFLILVFVAFLPFPTRVLGEHGGTPSAAILYAVSLCLVSAATAASWWYASGKANLLRPNVDPAQVRAARARSMSGPVFFALTVPIAAFAPYLAEVAWVVALPLARTASVWIISRQRERPRKRPG